MLNPFVDIALTVLNVIASVGDAIGKSADAAGSFIKYEKTKRESTNGQAIYGDLKNTENIIYQTNIYNTQPPLEFSLFVASQMMSNPELYGIERLQQLRNVSSSEYEKFYSLYGIHTPIILPESNSGAYTIGMMPYPIARYAFLNGIRKNHDIGVLERLRFNLYPADMMNSKHFYALSEYERIFFSDLYRDYRKLKNLVGSSTIKNFDDFVTPLYRQKVELETKQGWDYVLFQLTTRKKGNQIVVGTVPLKFKS